MLYVTTRNNRDAFTVSRALRENRGADGGLFVPFRSPSFSKKEIDGLKEQSFGQCVALVLNRLFQTSLSAWDIDFSIGRYPVRLETLRHRIVMVEPWHNPQWDYGVMVRNLVTLLGKNVPVDGDWARIAVRAAVLFGVFSELMRMGMETADITMVSGDFSQPISAWYARQWGLPVGNIICCCNENHQIWDLICHGHMRLDGISVSTCLPEADVAVPQNLERLIYECGGIQEVQKYLQAYRLGGSYVPNEGVLAKLRKGLYASVVSSGRIETIIPSVYATHQYLLSATGAFAYAGLLDYRAKTGAIRPALVWSEKSPEQDAERVAKALRVSEETLRR